MTSSDIFKIVVTVGVIQCLCDLFSYYSTFRKERYTRAVEKVYREQFKVNKAQQDLAVAKDKATAAAAATATTDKNSTTTTTTTKSRGSNKTASSKSHSSQKALEKHEKKVKQTEDDYANACAAVAGQHTWPQILSSGLFIMLIRVLGMDYQGTVVALLPFTPYPFLYKRITGRGLDFSYTGNMDGTFESLSAAAAASGEAGAATVTTSKVDNVYQACSFLFIYMLATISVKYYVHQLVGTHPPPQAHGVMAIVKSPYGRQVIKKLGMEDYTTLIDEATAATATNMSVSTATSTGAATAPNTTAAASSDTATTSARRKKKTR